MKFPDEYVLWKAEERDQGFWQQECLLNIWKMLVMYKYII